jgi:hypothetical protein
MNDHFPRPSATRRVHVNFAFGMVRFHFDHLRYGVTRMSKTEAQESTLTWRKATYSVANGACTEVAAVPGTLIVRDSTNPDGTRLRFGTGAWQEFIDRIKDA